jgi:DNA-binding transcriptional regulator YiaG
VDTREEEEREALLAQLREAEIGSRALANILDVAEATARQWMTGRRSMPPPVEEILRLVLKFRARKPAPPASDN